MLKAIIFDCFGVLTTDAWLPFKAKYFGHDRAIFKQAGALNKQADAGLINYQEFIIAIAELAHISAEEAGRTISNNIANEAIFNYIMCLKPTYKIGMLSNAATNWLDELFKPGQIALFDAIALSCETGYIKPDPRAYEIIAKRLNVKLDECMLIDDQERYCRAAREAGMQALVFKSNEQFETDIQKILAN